jgi:hypothetical protein
MDDGWKKQARKDILDAFGAAEKLSKPPVMEMFNGDVSCSNSIDVYDELTPALKEQKLELERLMKAYPDAYDSKSHMK